MAVAVAGGSRCRTVGDLRNLIREPEKTERYRVVFSFVVSCMLG